MIIDLGLLLTLVIFLRSEVGGVLQQTRDETLCIQPGFLRSALLKKAFFPAEGIPFPGSIWEALISSSAEPAHGYLELIYARGRAEAAISEEAASKNHSRSE